MGLAGETDGEAWPVIQGVLQLQSQDAAATPSKDSSKSGVNGNITSANESGSIKLLSIVQAQSSISPSLYIGQSHSKKDSIATAINRLVGFLKAQKDKSKEQSERKKWISGTCSGGATHIQQEMTLYKEFHEPGASKEDSLAAFKILRNYITVQILTSINDKDLCVIFLQDQIDWMEKLNWMCFYFSNFVFIYFYFVWLWPFSISVFHQDSIVIWNLQW